MKQDIITVGIVLFVVSSLACTNNGNTESTNKVLDRAKNVRQIEYLPDIDQQENLERSDDFQLNTDKNKISFIPDSNVFVLKRINETIKREDVLRIQSLKNLNPKQIDAWIKPIPNRNDYIIESSVELYKAVSFQKKAEKYSSIILMQVDNIEKDKIIGEQFLVTIDNNGKYIDCLPVSYIKNRSNSEVELDTARSIYIFTTNTKSLFNGDTIKVIQLSTVSNMPDSHEEKDYWEELSEILYLIKEDGKIVLFRNKQKLKDNREQNKK